MLTITSINHNHIGDQPSPEEYKSAPNLDVYHLPPFIPLNNFDSIKIFNTPAGALTNPMNFNLNKNLNMNLKQLKLETEAQNLNLKLKLEIET